jgi:hypothetical protein
LPLEQPLHQLRIVSQLLNESHQHQ